MQAERKVKPTSLKKIILPSEHGSWSWMLVPYLVGLLVSRSFHPAALFVLIGGLSAFLIRQPATVWLRARRGKGRRADAKPAKRWLILFSSVSLVSLAALLAWDRWSLLWLALPFTLLLALYLFVALRRRREVRTLWMEVAGAAALALMAPAAMIAVSGELTVSTASVFFLLALQNILGVFYVRLRIADTHQRMQPRNTIMKSHLFGITALLLVRSAASLPWLSLLPFIFFLLRAFWTARRPRPIANIKRFGFAEIGVELTGGLIISLAYLNL